MSADESDRIEINKLAVSLTKELVRDKYMMPTVRFQIQSNRSSPARVWVTESLPEEVTNDLHLHPQYHADRWDTYDDGGIVFDSGIAPGETITTLYGVQTGNAATVRRYMSQPNFAVAPVENISGDRGTDVSDTKVFTEGSDYLDTGTDTRIYTEWSEQNSGADSRDD